MTNRILKKLVHIKSERGICIKSYIKNVFMLDLKKVHVTTQRTKYLKDKHTIIFHLSLIPCPLPAGPNNTTLSCISNYLLVIIVL